jgi:YggT family protein
VAAMVLDAIGEITLFIQVFSGVYTLALILYVLSSWIRVPYSLSPVVRFLYDICDPYLRLWRRILPMSFGAIDFTPMIAIFALIIGTQIVVAVLDRLP